MRHSTLVAASFAVALLNSTGLAQHAHLPVTRKPADWPQYRHDAAHTGANPFETTLDASNVAALSIKWISSTSGGFGAGVFAAPAVVDGVVWLLSQDGHLYAFNAQNGAQIADPVTGGYGSSSAAVAGGQVLVGAVSGVYSFSTQCTGTCGALWHTDGHTTVNPPLAVSGDRVYASSYFGTLDVLDLHSGTVVATRLINVADPVFGAASVADDIVYVPADYGLYAFDVDCIQNCAPRWFAPTPFAIERAPAVGGGSVYVADDQGTLLALDAKTGVKRWSSHISALPTPAALGDGMVFVAGLNGTLYAFAQNSPGPVAQPIWTVSTGQALYEPVYANGVVYVGALSGLVSNGTFYAFRASDGALLSATTVAGAIESGASIVEGRVYVGTLTGAVYCFGL